MDIPVRYHIKTNQVFAEGIDYQWQADLADLGSVQKYNNGFRYLLTCIEFSQRLPGSRLVCLWYLHLKLISRPTGNNIPIQTDDGTELWNRVQEYIAFFNDS